ncbi:MAG: hypothetical protein QOI12_3444 [Alphaproteobacteria bacterium]|jgi:hypothetical protein|nr:hypothetical protein [Alphaproteobacteria bacterium]
MRPASRGGREAAGSPHEACSAQAWSYRSICLALRSTKAELAKDRTGSPCWGRYLRAAMISQ